VSIYRNGREVTDALGDEFNRLAGAIATRLVADLPPAGHETPPAGAVAAQVETTWAMDAAGGEVMIRGERIPYTSAGVGLLSGLTRDPFVTETYRRGELVVYLGRTSALDEARAMLLARTAEGPYLAVKGRNLGVPRYLNVTEPTYRLLILALAYMPAKGSRDSLDTLLAALFADQGLDGTGEAFADGRVVAAVGTFKASMRGLMVDVGAPAIRTRILRVSGDGATIWCDRQGSPHWLPAAFPPANPAAFHVHPWAVSEPADRPCTVRVTVRTRPAASPLGYAYLAPAEIVTPVAVGQVAVTHTIRQVLGVWLATDAHRTGTNYATSNTFAGSVVTLDTPLPGALPDVVVDYGWAYPEGGAGAGGLPGDATGRGTAEILPGVHVRNPDPIMAGEVQVGELVRYPLYLGGRLSALRAILDALTVAGVIAESDIGVWES
jgi:hypothetical protein